MCWKCYFLYRKQYQHRKECPTCPKCGADRCDSQGKPRAVFAYRPIRLWLERLFACFSPLAAMLRWHADNKLGAQDELADVTDGSVYKEARSKAPFKDDPRHLLLLLALDGFLVFSGDDRYSCWPLVLTALNMPPWLRGKLGLGSTLLGIVPGTRKEEAKPKLIYVKELIQEELRYLYKTGHQVTDSSMAPGSPGSVFTCHVQLLHTASDSRCVSFE